MSQTLILFKIPFSIAGETITNVLDFKREAGLWHGVLTVSGVEPSGKANGRVLSQFIIN